MEVPACSDLRKYPLGSLATQNYICHWGHQWRVNKSVVFGKFKLWMGDREKTIYLHATVLCSKRGNHKCKCAFKCRVGERPYLSQLRRLWDYSRRESMTWVHSWRNNNNNKGNPSSLSQPVQVIWGRKRRWCNRVGMFLSSLSVNGAHGVWRGYVSMCVKLMGVGGGVWKSRL